MTTSYLYIKIFKYVLIYVYLDMIRSLYALNLFLVFFLSTVMNNIGTISFSLNEWRAINNPINMKRFNTTFQLEIIDTQGNAII